MNMRRGHGENGEPEAIGSILEMLRTTTDFGKQLDQAQIWERWPEVVGVELAEHSKPAGVRDSTLTVEVENAIWMHRLSYCKPDLLARINGLLAQEELSEIFLTLASDEADSDTENDREKA